MGPERVAVVTGAGRGIGAEIARTLVDQGAVVALADIVEPGTWSHDLGVDGPHSRHVVDVTDATSCRALIDAVVATHGRIDHLVNNAGIVRRGPAATVAVDDFTDVIDVNLTGTFQMSQAAYGALRATSGSIVNIASTSGAIAVRNTVGYCVSKAGVIHLTRVLALEWAADGIRVNAVGPTIVPTDMTVDVRGDEAYMREKMASIPLGRMASANDVADSVAFLLGDTSSMVTGQVVYIDGGVTTQ